LLHGCINVLRPKVLNTAVACVTVYLQCNNSLVLGYFCIFLLVEHFLFSIPISAQNLTALLAALVLALAVSALLVLTKHYHGHVTMDSHHGVQKFHVHPTPRVGGIGIYVGLVAGWLLVKDGDTSQMLKTIVLAGIPAFAFGILEDLTKEVGVLPRLLATMASGLVACMMAGISLGRVDVPLVDEAFKWAPVAVLFTAFAIGGVANAINIIDGFHGLASGTAIMIALALAAIATKVGDAPLALAAVLVAAAITGFWLLNYPWGKIFLGDGGAYFTGFALAWLAVLLLVRNPKVSPWVALLVFAYPVIEVLYSVVRRYRDKQSPGAPDGLHLHSLVKIQVIRKQLSHWSTNMQNAAVSPCIWVFAALPAIVGTALFDAAPTTLGLVFVVFVLLYHLTYQALAQQPVTIAKH
jgi:UDP-N-acetylmuramyl pentapeptide phosphotransferase/UDP-N-acetylglucosamine-1-phosphate transferase